MARLQLVILAAVFLSGLVTVAHACRCAFEPVCSRYSRAVKVFTGRVTAINIEEMERGDTRTVTFQVIERFKGNVKDFASVEFPVSDCAPKFVIGKEYLLYDYYRQRADDNICNGTLPIDFASPGLEYARQARSGPPRYGLYVTVNGISGKEASTGIATVNTGNEIITLKPDDYGEFMFSTLKTGKFVFSMSFPFDVVGGMQIFNPPWEYIGIDWGLEKFEKEFDLKPNDCKLLEINVKRKADPDHSSDR